MYIKTRTKIALLQGIVKVTILTKKKYNFVFLYLLSPKYHCCMTIYFSVIYSNYKYHYFV